MRHSSLARLLSITCPLPVTPVYKQWEWSEEASSSHVETVQGGLYRGLSWQPVVLSAWFSQGNHPIYVLMSLSLCIPAQPKTVTAAHVPGRISYTAG